MSDLLSAALTYARRGWPVFPTHDTTTGACSCPLGEECGSPAKHPRTARGLNEASTSTALIAAWWRRWPSANVAIATGLASFDVLDVDVLDETRNGWDAFRRIREAGLASGAHSLVVTPRAGVHLYFRPDGNRNHSLAEHHIDVRADGGYVLAPPSVVMGKRYVLIERRADADGILRWDAIKAMLAPPRPVRPTAGRSGSIGGLIAWLSDRRDHRNNALFWASCRAIESGVTDLAGLQPLVDVTVGLGLTETASELTAKSALATYGLLERRS